MGLVLQIKVLSGFFSSKSFQRALKLVIFAPPEQLYAASESLFGIRLASIAYLDSMAQASQPSLRFLSPNRKGDLFAFCMLSHSSRPTCVLVRGPLACRALDLQLPCSSDCASTGCTHQDRGSSGTAKDTVGNEGPGFSGSSQIPSIH